MREIQEVKASTNSRFKSNSRNIFKLAFLIAVLIICIVLLIAYKKEESSFSNLVTSIKERVLHSTSTSIGSIKFEPGSYPVFMTFESGVVCARNDGIKIYNIKGQEEWSDPKAFTSPFIQVSEKYMVVADKKGKKIYLYQNRNELWNEIIDGEIQTVSVNNKGYVGIIYKDVSYKSVVKVFDNKGSEVLVRYYSNNYALDVKISPNNNAIGIGELDLSRLRTSSLIRLIPAGSKDGLESFEEDSILECMEFINGKLVAVLNNKLLSIKQDGSKNLLKDFGKDKVTNVCLNGETFIVKVQKSTGLLNLSSNLEVINEQGKSIGTFNAGFNVINIDIKKNIIAINGGGKVVFINSAGRKISQFNPQKAVKEIKLFSDGAHAVIAYVDGIDIVSIH